MLAAPVSRLPWMISTLTTPLGKWPSAFTTLLVSTPPAQGLHPSLPTYQAVWLLELAQSTEGFGQWNHAVLGVEHFSARAWDSGGLGVVLLLCVIGVGPGKLSQVCSWEDASGGIWGGPRQSQQLRAVRLWVGLSLWAFLSLPVKMEELEFAGKHLFYLRHFFPGPLSLDSREAPLTRCQGPACARRVSQPWLIPISALTRGCLFFFSGHTA